MRAEDEAAAAAAATAADLCWCCAAIEASSASLWNMAANGEVMPEAMPEVIPDAAASSCWFRMKLGHSGSLRRMEKMPVNC